MDREPRRPALRRALALVLATLLWNTIEALVAVWAGVRAGSVALLGFGVDSFVETASAAIVGWRLGRELRGRPTEIERIERRTARVAGALLLGLAAYVLADGGRRLLGFGPRAGESLVGIVLTLASLAVMPLLGHAKLRAARELRSAALRADAFETIACAWLSGTTLAGLALNALLGWWWADPAAGLLLVPLLWREGWRGLRGEEGVGERRPSP